MRRTNRRQHGFRLQHHAGAAAVRPIVHGLVDVLRMPARVFRADTQQAPLDGPAQHTETQRTFHHFGEERNDFDMQRHSSAFHAPLARGETTYSSNVAGQSTTT
jgi:hypothetical protein